MRLNILYLYVSYGAAYIHTCFWVMILSCLWRGQETYAASLRYGKRCRLFGWISGGGSLHGLPFSPTSISEGGGNEVQQISGVCTQAGTVAISAGSGRIGWKE